MAMSSMFSEKTVQIEQLTEYIFTDKLLCAEAVQMARPHVTISHEGVLKGLDNNKRLAIVGDAVLHKVLSGKWYQTTNEQGTPLSLADWTEIRKRLTSNDALAQRGTIFHVDKYISTAQGIPASPLMIATTMKAIIGAVFVDGGDSAVLNVTEHLGFFHHSYITIPQGALQETSLISLIKRRRFVLLLAAFGSLSQDLNAGWRLLQGGCALL